MAHILCYGDSNTFGYDPRGWLGGRYESDVRWTGRLKAAGYAVRNLGQNGLTVPSPGEAYLLTDRLGDLSELHTLTVMLGTNDLLRDAAISAEDVAARLSRWLTAVTAALPPEKLLLISPVPLVPGDWVTDPRQLTESARLGTCLSASAAAAHVRFADAAAWGVQLAFDGVHFTPSGHAAFAAGLLQIL